MVVEDPQHRSSGGLDDLPLAALTLDDLVPGDVLLMSRPSLIQTLSEKVGDPFRHSAIVAMHLGELSVVEIGFQGIQSRTLDQATTRYTTVGVGRLPEVYRESIANLAVTALQRRSIAFPYWLLLPLGLTALVRHLGLSFESRALWPLRSIAQRLEASRGTNTCASFVTEVLTETGIQVLVEDENADGGSRRLLPPVMEGLMMPGDIWYSDALSERFMLDADQN